MGVMPRTGESAAELDGAEEKEPIMAFTQTIADQLEGHVLAFTPRDTAPQPTAPRPPLPQSAPRPAPPRTPATAPVAAEQPRPAQGPENEPPTALSATERRTALQATQQRLAESQAEVRRLTAALSNNGGWPPVPAAAPRTVFVRQIVRQDSDSRVAELETEVAELRRLLSETRQVNQKLTKQAATKGVSSRAGRRDQWADDESWIRHEVYTAWVERVPAQNRDEHALPADYRISDRFAASLNDLDDPQFDKAMKCVVDVLTNLAKDNDARAIHALRTGDNGAPAYTRADGAKCLRAYVEVKTASARRLHYWAVPGGRIDLERIVLHDDVEP